MSFQSLKSDLKDPEVAGNGPRSSYSRPYEFGKFRLDPAKRLLLCEGVVVPLTSKALDVLLLLVSRQGQVVGKDEILSRVWPDTIVEENNLNVNVSLLRRTFGEKPNDHHYIVTMPGVGYQFVAEVRFGGGTEQAVQRIDPRKSNRERQARGLVLFVIVLGAVVGIWFVLHRITSLNDITRFTANPTGHFQALTVTRVTNTGKVKDAAISPDGKYVVHVVDDGKQQSLWLIQVLTSDRLQIIPPANVDYYPGLTFSPDGNYIYYGADDGKGPAALYQISVLGGISTRILTDIDSVITFSPDGKQFAFLRGYPETQKTALMVANLDGSSERTLAMRRMPNYFNATGAGGVAWSPDGKVIVCSVSNTDESGSYMTLVAVGLVDGLEEPVTAGRWLGVGKTAWMRDGSGVVFTASERQGSSQIWYLTYPGREVHRVTGDVNDYTSVGLTADSSAMFAIQSEQVSNIWIASNDNINAAHQISDNNFDGVRGISWTPDGKIVYASRATTNVDLWMIDANGNTRKQLTRDAGTNVWPSVLPDGRSIIFQSNRTGTRHIWRMDIDGSNPKQLTNGDGEAQPKISHDGQWAFFFSPSHMSFLKVAVVGGKTVQVTDNVYFGAALSPDGRWIAARTTTPPYPIALYPSEGGTPRILNFQLPDGFRWTPDGSALAFVDPNNPSHISGEPIDGGPTKALTNSIPDRIFNFTWSPDGKQLAFARGTLTRDVVLIKNFKDRDAAIQ